MWCDSFIGATTLNNPTTHLEWIPFVGWVTVTVASLMSFLSSLLILFIRPDSSSRHYKLLEPIGT